MTQPADQATFADRVDLRQIDRDIFTGWCHSGAPLKAYGGQIAAQALMAAGLTVDEPDRHIHSLHGYFLRPGGTKDWIVYLVERPRDGGSFSTRVVRAVQQGEVIFMMTASFARAQEGPSHQVPAPDAAPPETLTEVRPALATSVQEVIERRALGYPESVVIDLRLDDPLGRVELVDNRYERSAWVRISDEVGGDWLHQACALTYLSDLTMVPTALSPHFGDIDLDRLQTASIDHAMWFHGPARADRWLLFAQDTPVASGGHGLARGLFFDTDGRLVASVVQESLMRERRP